MKYSSHKNTTKLSYGYQIHFISKLIDYSNMKDKCRINKTYFILLYTITKLDSESYILNTFYDPNWCSL